MYYLLKNNRIIDSRMSYTVNIPYWEIKDNCLFAKSKNDKLVRPYNKNKIKKQSENVLELIEVGDLVKTLGIFRVDEINTPLKQIYSFLDRESTMVINTLGVNAIYKPDEKGNYIKVWEVKEDEKE